MYRVIRKKKFVFLFLVISLVYKINNFQYFKKCFLFKFLHFFSIQGDFESCADILITSYWLHVELGKNV
jgi:hypothetical protein